jgi:hypothetical protein
VDRFWRKTATNAIGEDEKKLLRQQLLLTLNEPVTQVIILCVCVCTMYYLSFCKCMN